MAASTLEEMISGMAPANLVELQAMVPGDFGYDDVQAAARTMLQNGDVAVYAAAVEKWEAEKP